MTEKRFTVDSDGKYFDRVNQRYVTLDKLFDELNMLHEENEEFKTKFEYHERMHNKWKSECMANIKENEQLKSENEELENKIELLEGKLWNCQNVR